MTAINYIDKQIKINIKGGILPAEIIKMSDEDITKKIKNNIWILKGEIKMDVKQEKLKIYNKVLNDNIELIREMFPSPRYIIDYNSLEDYIGGEKLIIFEKLLNKQVKAIFSHSGGGYWDKNDSYYYARKIAKEYVKHGIKLGGKIDEYINKKEGD